MLALIFKNNGDVQSYNICRETKMMSHTIKIWESVLEARLREEGMFCDQHYGFMPRKSSSNAIFHLGMLMGKCREG